MTNLKFAETRRITHTVVLVVVGALLIHSYAHAERFSIAVLSDLSVTNEASTALLNKAVQKINALPDVKLTVVIGNVSSDNRRQQYDFAKKALDRLQQPYVAVPGSQDSAKAGYLEYFKEPRWVREEGDWSFIGLDSSEPVSTTGMDWLKEQLGNIPAGRPIALFMHHPLNPVLKPYRVKNADEVLALFTERDLRLVASGRAALNDEEMQNGVLFTTNACCSMTRDNNGPSRDKGLRLFHLNHDTVETEFIPVRLSGLASTTGWGWVTSFSYLAVALICARSARRARKAHEPRRASIWLGLAVFMVVLGVSKQLGLQAWLMSEGRHLAKTEGWYPERREVQAALISAVVFSGFVVLAFFLWLARTIPARSKLTVLALSYLLGFIVIRAASYHYVDILLGWKWHSLTVNTILENGGLLCLAFSALWENAGHKASPSMPHRARPLHNLERGESVVPRDRAGDLGKKQEPPATPAVDMHQPTRVTASDRRRALLQGTKEDFLTRDPD